MASQSKMAEIEKESLKDLDLLVTKIKQWHIDMAVIGGYAVRAYTNAYRHTKDIDMAIDKEMRGSLLAFLKSLKYGTRATEFGIAAIKRFDSDFVDIHISVGKIYDISTGLHYPIRKELFNESKTMEVKPKFEANKNFATKAPVVDLNTLIILKFMPKGRPEKDGIDIVSLLLNRIQDIDIDAVVKKADKAGLADHMLSQIQDFAMKLRNGESARIWSRVTGTNLTGVQIRSIQKFLRELDKALRS